jgi:hypothetical protein
MANTSMENETRPVQASARISRVRARLESASDRRFFLLAFLPLLIIYLATANWSTPKTDALTNAIAAWSIGTSGSAVLDEHAAVTEPGVSGVLAYIVESEEGPVSKYPPGAALLAAPIYAVWPQEAELIPPGDARRWDDFDFALVLPPFAPAAITAALVTALAVAVAGLTARVYVGSTVAMAGTYVYGLATGAWGVAADTLWQHGPAMLWLALGIYLAVRDRGWWSGIAFGLAVLTRPITAVIVAVLGLSTAWRERSPWPAVRLGVGSLAGLAVLLFYNAVVFGSATISGGYSRNVADVALDSDLVWYVRNVLGGLFDPAQGLLTVSPFIIALGVGTFREWKALPGVLRSATLGAIAYLLVQWKLNRYSGGDGFVGYRYPLEAIAALAPALYFGWTWISQNRRRTFIFVLATAYAVSIYAAFSI